MKQKSVHLVLSICLLVFISGCATSQPTPQKSQLQIREFQTRSYATSDTKMVMKAVLNVLQDEGFIVKNANLELGLLSATKEVDVENTTEKVVAMLFSGKDARYGKNSIMECSANISEYGKETRVRVNFQVKKMDNAGGVISVTDIGDENHYTQFFSKVDKGIFIQKEKL